MKKKNLSQWLEYLESIHPSEIEMGLGRVNSVAQAMQLIRPAGKVILVAGTNGKGSTVTYCRSILLQAGFSVGSYMSPHLHIYNERVMINGVMASDEDLIESFEVIDQARGDVTLTYFEVGTLSALYLFKKFHVDFAVIEVGLGGRLDATNVVDPDVSVVTSIGLDHQDWLGDDIDKIAFEKAGVYRKDKAAVCGQLNVSKGLVDYAKNIGANLLLRGNDFSLDISDSTWNWRGKSIDQTEICFNNMPLPNLPLENAATALQALVQIYPDLKQDQVEQGLKQAMLPGRMQVIETPFNGVLDVGHNPQAAKLVAQRCADASVKGRRYGLLAMLDDKDANGVVSELKDVVDEWCLAGISGYRGQSSDQLAKKLEGLMFTSKQYGTIESALDDLAVTMTADDEVLIMGSFMTVAAAQNWLKGI